MAACRCRGRARRLVSQWQAPCWQTRGAQRVHRHLAALAASKSEAAMGRSFLKKATRRRHDSGLKFRTPRFRFKFLSLQRPLWPNSRHTILDIRGVGRAADAVKVGSRPWFRFFHLPLLAVHDVGTWAGAGSMDAVTSGISRAADGGTSTPVAPPPSAPVALAFFFGCLTGFGITVLSLMRLSEGESTRQDQKKDKTGVKRRSSHSSSRSDGGFERDRLSG